MEIIKILLIPIIGILGLLKGKFETMKDKILTGILIALVIVGGILSYNQFKIEVNKKKQDIEKCNKMLSYACDQIHGTLFTYMYNKQYAGDSIATKLSIKDFRNNSNMLGKFLDIYKDNIDTSKTKTIIRTIGFLNEYSEELTKDQQALNSLNSLICEIDTTQKNRIPLFINKN